MNTARPQRVGVLLGILAGVFYWLLDALVEAYVFKLGDFPSRLIAIDAEQLWMRSTTAIVFILFGWVVDLYIQKLRANALHLQQAQRAAKLGFWEWDLQNNTLFQSANTEQIIDIQRDEDPA